MKQIRGGELNAQAHRQRPRCSVACSLRYARGLRGRYVFDQADSDIMTDAILSGARVVGLATGLPFSAALDKIEDVDRED